MIRKIIQILAVAILMAACTAKSGLITKKEFTKIYLDSLVREFPKAKFEIADDSTIICKYSGGNMRLASENIYAEYKLESDSIGQIVGKYVSSLKESFIEPGYSEKIDVSRIVPTIKSSRYITDLEEQSRQMGGPQKTEWVYEKYNEDLIVVYMIDGEKQMAGLTKANLDTLHLTMDSIRAIAPRNLLRILPELKITKGNGVYLPIAGADYDASFILLPNIMNRTNFPVNGDWVIAIPSRDILLITGSKDQPGIDNIRGQCKEIYAGGGHLVSPFLFKWNGKKFERYKD
jgi:uncharacterized protein YtpQ (UPF0354 family)